MSVTMKIDPKDLRDFNSLMNEMSIATGADMKKVIRNTARDLTFKLIGFTPIAPKGIKSRGFAKQGWIEVAKELGTSPRANYAGKTGAVKNLHKTVRDETKDRLRFELSNMIPYIEEIEFGSDRNKAANTMPRAFKATTKLLAKRIDKIVARKMKQRFK